MTDAAEMGRTSVKGGFHVMWGLVASTVISAVGTIIIAGMLGAELYGLYAISLTAPGLIVLFRDWGVNTAMTRYTAQYNVEKRSAEIRKVFTSGLVFETTLGVLLSLVCFAMAGWLADSVFQRPVIAPLIEIASLTVLSSGLIATATAVFVGIERTHMNSVMLVVQSVTKTVVAPALIIAGFGVIGAAGAHVVASVVAGLTGVLMIFLVHKSLPAGDGDGLEIWKSTKLLVRYGLPLSFAGILSGVLLQYYGFLMAIYVTDNAIIGNYAIAQNFAVLITFFSFPVTTMLLPAFSKLNWRSDHETLQSVFQFSVKYGSLLVVPFSVMVMVVAEPAISTLFRASYVEAPLFLALLAITYVFTVLGSLSTGNLINSQGHTRFTLVLTVVTCVIGFVLGFVLISTMGVLGLIVTSVVAGVPGVLISLVYVKRRYNVTMDWGSSGKILFSSLVAAVVTYVVVGEVGFLPSVVQLVVGVGVFGVVCVLAVLLTRTLNRGDLDNLRNMSVSLGPLRRVVELFMRVVDWLMVKFRL